MKCISELFEFLSNCDNETLINELTEHCERLYKKNGTKSERRFKLDVENLNTVFRLSEWYLSSELPRMIAELNPQKGQDVLMTVEEVSKYMKVTPAMVYNLIKKGKLKKVGISSVDKPGARESIRVWKSEVDRYLGK